MKAIYWHEARSGFDVRNAEIPSEMRAECLKVARSLVEAAAESDEALMAKYLEGMELTEAEIKRGIRARTIANEIVPALCGSAFRNKGVQAMLDAVVEYLPAPPEVNAIEGVLEDGSDRRASVERR